MSTAEQIAAGELMIAHAKNPKLKVEFKTQHDEDQWSPVVREKGPTWDWLHLTYRLAPSPKLRAWKPEEVFPLIGNTLVRYKRVEGNDSIGTVLMVGGVSESCLVLSSGQLVSLKGALVELEHSLNGGKTWHPCGVLEDAA